jgi:hypothetical protein
VQNIFYFLFLGALVYHDLYGATTKNQCGTLTNTSITAICASLSTMATCAPWVK